MNIPPTESPFWTSPALALKSKHWPKRYGDRVPLLIKMNMTVRPDFICLMAEPKRKTNILNEGELYHTTVNSHGAVCGICDDGQTLGVKPDEFEVIEWYQPEVTK